jgi:hypothetical protein
MGFPTSVIGRQNSFNAISALGIVLEKPNFPVTVSCPLCQQNALYVFDDIVTDGLWLSCTACQARGDIITFGAQVWNTSLPNALSKFSDLNLISRQESDRAAPDYVRFAAKQQAAADFWSDVKSQVWNHGDDIIALRLREFGVRHEAPDCFGLVGVAQNDQVAEMCAAMGRTKPQRMRDGGHTLVYPFHDLPGRFTGFLLTQYNEEFESRQNFIPIDGFKKRKPEAGYFLLDKLLVTPGELFKGHQFISEDIHWVLRTQARLAGKGLNSFPLVAGYSGPEAESYGTSWQAFHSAPRIFHANVISPNVVSRACNARGYVSVISLSQPTDIKNVISMRANAKTWQDSLQTALLNCNEINAQSFASRLYLPHDKLGAFLGKLDHPFSTGFSEKVLATIPNSTTTPQQKWMVIERDNCWWNHLGRMIVNVCPRITKIMQADDGGKIYVGTITAQNGEVYTFSDSAVKIDRMGLLAYSNAILAPHNKLVIYDKLWNARSLVFALQLHPPEIVTVSTQYGWDAHNKVFRFDRYEITNTGDVRQTPPWPGKKSLITFDDPTPVAPLPIRDFLTPAHENSYIWNITAAVIENLVAPVLNRDPAPTAIDSGGFKTALALANVFCCPVERATAASKHCARGFFARFAHPVEWPTLVCNTFSDDMLSNIVPRHSNLPLLVRLSRQAAATAPGYGWQMIKSTPVKQAADVSVLRHVVPAYVQYVLLNRAQMFKSSDSLYCQVLKNMHEWLLATYGNSFNLPHALANVRDPEMAHVAMMEELYYAFSSGKIAILPQARRKDQPKNYILQKKEHWWLNRTAIDRYFYVARSVAPNWMAVVDLLQQNGVYMGDQTIHNMAGVFVNSDWCQQFWSAQENKVDKETG